MNEAQRKAVLNGQDPNAPKGFQSTSGNSTVKNKSRKSPKVKAEGALAVANNVIERTNSLDAYTDNMTAAIGKRVDDAAFQIAATIASVPAQLAARTEYYLKQMGGEDAWSQFDRALTSCSASRSTGEQLLFNSDFFALPEGDVFE